MYIGQVSMVMLILKNKLIYFKYFLNIIFVLNLLVINFFILTITQCNRKNPMKKTAAVIRNGKNEVNTMRKHTKSQWTYRNTLVNRVGGKFISKNSKTCTIRPGIGAGVPTKSSSSIKNNVPETVGTVDRAIREKNIFTALSKMPVEVQKTLLENGWIEKKAIDVVHNSKEVLSLHKNVDRVKAVSKRYDSGLMWTDAQTGRINWLTLNSSVLVNRFPRDGFAEIKLCGNALAGKFIFNDCYPRAYSTINRYFIEDYSLTACVSLLSTFVKGDAKSIKNGKVPISALQFAIHKCSQYVAYNGRIVNTQLFSGEGAEWKTFFEHYYRIVNDNQNFTESVGEMETPESLTSSSKRLLEKLSALRPQMEMDGCKNVWIIKSKQSSDHQPFMLNKLDDILKKCTQKDDYIIQKYIEVPLLYKNVKFNVQTWILISTLDNCLSVWLYHMCCMHFYSHKFSVNIEKPKNVHFMNKFSINSPVLMQTCSLKQLKGKLRSMGIKKTHDSAVYSKIKTSIASSVFAAVDVLNLRPNCFELFQATFVLGNNLHPWLIEIKSDPCLTYTYHHTMSVISANVAKSMGKMLTSKNRPSKSKVGTFDLIYKSPIPGMYTPQAFIDKKPASKKSDRSKTNLNKMVYKHIHGDRICHWDNDLISTYIEKIHVNEIENTNEYSVPTFDFNSTAKFTDNVDIISSNVENSLCLIDLKESLARLKTGSKINIQEAKNCLQLLDKWKTRVQTAQMFYKTVLANNTKT